MLEWAIKRSEALNYKQNTINIKQLVQAYPYICLFHLSI